VKRAIGMIPAFEYATGDSSSPKALFPGTNWPEEVD